MSGAIPKLPEPSTPAVTTSSPATRIDETLPVVITSNPELETIDVDIHFNSDFETTTSYTVGDTLRLSFTDIPKEGRFDKSDPYIEIYRKSLEIFLER